MRAGADDPSHEPAGEAPPSDSRGCLFPTLPDICDPDIRWSDSKAGATSSPPRATTNRGRRNRTWSIFRTWSVSRSRKATRASDRIRALTRAFIQSAVHHLRKPPWCVIPMPGGVGGGVPRGPLLPDWSGFQRPPAFGGVKGALGFQRPLLLKSTAISRRRSRARISVAGLCQLCDKRPPALRRPSAAAVQCRRFHQTGEVRAREGANCLWKPSP